MCRSIKTLFNFEPPATEADARGVEIAVRANWSGYNAPSQANREAFERAVDEVTAAASKLIGSTGDHGGPA